MKLLFSFLLLSTLSFAQTVVNGGIYQNTTWTQANSPYLMTGSVVVFPGKTLTIEPGVQILVTPDYSFNTGNFNYLEIRGSLVANGTVNNPIIFRTTDNSIIGTQTWLGIRIKGSQGATISMDKFHLNDSFYGLFNDITEPGVTYNFSHCSFKNNNYAIQMNADMVYQNCLFEHNGVGQAAQIQYGTLTADSCVFNENFCSFTWTNTMNVTNSTFTGNQNNIIGSPGNVSNCSFIGNTFAFAEEYGLNIQNSYFSDNGVGIDNTGSCIVSNCTFENNDLAMRCADNSNLTNNVITNNGIGISVTANNPNTMLIADNVICSNSQYNLQNQTDKNFAVNANCFCTSDSTVIENYLFDGYDDITRGLVNYAIYDDSCQNIINYVVKVNLDGTNGLVEMVDASFELLQQTNTAITVHCSSQQVLQLVNLMGSVVHEQKMNPGTTVFDLPSHTNGVYFLRSLSGHAERIFLAE
ncbi:MAG: hypothetical protein ACO29Q_00280 [Crocinitomicaceae bacterium]